MTELNKTQLSEVERIKHAIDAIGSAGEEGKKAQEGFARQCAATAIKVKSPETYGAIIDALQASGEVYKTKASDARKWGHPNVAPKVESIFKMAAKHNKGGSVYNLGAMIATKLKNGDSTSPTAAIDTINAERTSREDKTHTVDGAKDAAKAAVRRALAKAGYVCAAKKAGDTTEIDAVYKAITDLPPPTTPYGAAAKSEEAETVPSTGDAVAEAADIGDDELEELLGVIDNALPDGTPKQRAALMSALMRK